MTTRLRRFWKRATDRGDAAADLKRPGRRYYPGRVELLEDRLVPALSVDFAGAIAASASGGIDMQSDAVANDSSGNVYITGSFSGTVDFDPGPSTTNLTSTGGRDIFVAKYSQAGTLIWADDIRGAAASSVAKSGGIAVDSLGNVVLTGTFSGSFNFHPGSGAMNLSAPGRSDVFIAKYSSSGGLAWAKQTTGSGTSSDQGYSIAVDNLGNVAVGGTFQGTATFGTTSFTAAGSSEAFTTKLDPRGIFLWTDVTTGLGSTVAQASGLAFDASNNLVVTGFYVGAIDFDPSIGVQQSPVSGSRGLFVEKYRSTGTLAWTRFVSSTDIAQGNGIATDSLGNLYVTGMFSQTASFGSGITSVNLTAAGFMDALVLKINTNGQYVWSEDLSSSGNNTAQGTGIALDNSGHVFIAGSYQGTLAVSAGQLLSSAGASDGFAVVYDVAGNYVTSQSYGGNQSDAVFGIGVNALGKVAIAGNYGGRAAFGTTILPSQSGQSIFVAQISTNNTSIPPGPSAPSVPTLQTSSDSGSSASDKITNAAKPVFNVATAIANDTVKLLRDGVFIGTRIGPGTITDPGPITDGNHVYTAIQVDGFGQISPSSSSMTITIDTTAPTIPAAPTLLSADDSGTLGDGITNIAQPRFTGIAEPNSTVQLLSSSVVIGTAVAAGNGIYTVKPAGSLGDSTLTIRVQAVDAAGNVSAAGQGVNLTIDTIAPAAPSTPALAQSDVKGASNVTGNRQPTLIGTVEVNATVNLLDASGSILGTGTANASGRFSIKMTNTLADGTYSIRVRTTDPAGNIGSASSPFSLTVSGPSVAVASPPPPTLLTVDDSGSKGDNLTNVTRPRLTGTAAVGTTVQIVNASGIVLGSVVVAGDGTYTATFTAALSNGPTTVQVRAIDSSGNLSQNSAAITITIDTTAPLAPVALSLLPTDDSGTVGDGITNATRPRISSTAEPNSTLKLVDGNGIAIVSGKVKSDGTIQLQPTTALPDGTFVLRAFATDAAGNTSEASSTLTLKIMANAPAQPSAPTLLASDDTGVVGDSKTSNRRPRFIGTTAPGVTVELLNGVRNVIATTTASLANGSYTLQPSSNLAVGTNSYSVRVRDVAGNVKTSAISLSLSIVDATAGDFDGDGKSDLGIFRQSTSQWIVRYSSGSGVLSNYYGATNLTDIPVNGDFDGTGKVSQGVFRPITGQWIINSPTGQRVISFGASGGVDIPVPGDYDGVGYTEMAVYRPSTAQWFVLGPNGGHLLGTFGAPGSDDMPAPGDYDGSGKTEMAVFRKSTAQWFYNSAAGGKLLGVFGASGGIDIPVSGDYDGIGKTELAVFRPSTAQWFANGPQGGHLIETFGATDYVDIPVETAAAFLKTARLVNVPRPASLVISTAAIDQPLVIILPLETSTKKTAKNA